MTFIRASRIIPTLKANTKASYSLFLLLNIASKRSFSVSSAVFNKDFESQLKEAQGQPVVVDFYATWCGPCRMIAPILEKAVKENGKVKLIKVDVDEDGESAQKYNVSSLPTVVAFQNGKPVDSFIGLRDATFMKNFLQKLTSSN